MRRYILCMIMAAFTFITIQQQASAGEESEEKKDGGDKAWINCVSEGGETSVNLHLPGATEERIATFRLKLYVEDEPKVVFTEEAKRRARVCESRYNKDTNILSVYVSASRSSVDYPIFKNDSLAVCKLTATDSEGNPVSTGAKLLDSEDAFRIVKDKEAVNIALEDRTKAKEQDAGEDAETSRAGEEISGNAAANAGVSDTVRDKDGDQSKRGGGKDFLPYMVIGAAGVTVFIVIDVVVSRRHGRRHESGR